LKNIIKKEKNTFHLNEYLEKDAKYKFIFDTKKK